MYKMNGARVSEQENAPLPDTVRMFPALVDVDPRERNGTGSRRLEGYLMKMVGMNKFILLPSWYYKEVKAKACVF